MKGKHMNRLLNHLAISALLLTGILAVTGCQSTGSSASSDSEQAVMCSKCKTVWVHRPHQMGKITVFRNEKTMVCPDCQSLVESFFSTGKFQHTCKTCGDSMEKCSVHN
jgi:hypothetical protein